MKAIYKLLSIILFGTVLILFISTIPRPLSFPEREFPYDMKVVGDLTVDSSLFLGKRTVGTSDSTLVLENGEVKIKISTSTYWTRSSGVLYPTTIEDTVSIGSSSPDSLLHVAGGAVIETDVLVGGGWHDWSPTFVWTGGIPAAPTTVARYNVVNNEVRFHITISGANDSGFTLTGLNITLPITPKDNDAYVPVLCLYDDNCVSCVAYDRIGAAIDATDNSAANRKLYVQPSTFSVLNEYEYMFMFDGKYEISQK